MGQNIINPIQNISYTSKDFETVYPEILDLVKTLTYKWDPSISNESDPGVILIKLLAILEDKCNYNIDKNILETFPLSVTQNTNARQLFAQLGYFMHWYKSATTTVSMRWIGEKNDSFYTIPAFTMVSDEDATVVYTLVGPSANTSTSTFNVGSQRLRTSDNEISFKAIQGVAVNYDVAGNTLITYDYLDSKNRLYFDTIDIAENGIFICNNGQNNYKDWVRKDNLLVESLGNCFYKFGVTNDATKCYIEFPSDAEKLFQEGINITYIKTDGSNGNVAARVLSRFYNDLIPAEDRSIQLSVSNVQIYNPSAGINGADPEDINEAYNNYMHTVGTFETLTTLRDYINKIYETGLVSNDFVCDRTNDIQSVYTIQATVNDLDQPQTVVEKTVVQRTATDGTLVSLEEPLLSAFDLKLYLLQISNDLTTQLGYDRTFKIMTEAQSSNVKAVIDDIKSIQHDYQEILPVTANQSHFCYFINKYPVNWTVKTQYAVSDNIWTTEILANIKKALYENLNAHKVGFGEAIDPDYLYEVIMNADKRIKTIYKGNIDYKTYAVYFDGKEFKEELINPEYFNNEVTCVASSSEFSAKCDFDTFVSKIGSATDYNTVTFKYDGSTWSKDSSAINLSDYGITIKGTPKAGSTLTARISLRNQFRDEIYIKSVLAGKTQFFVKDEEFDYQLNQSLIGFTDAIDELGGEVTINLSNTDANESTYNLRTNETLRLYAPNLIDDTTYSDYVKFSFYSPDNIVVQSGESYELKANEYVTFYWRESTDSLYSFACYGQGNIITPNATSDTFKSSMDDTFATTLKLTDLEEGNATYPRYGLSGICPSAQSDKVSTFKSEQILSGNKLVTVKKVNQITLKAGGYDCYWITDNYDTDINDVKRYILFEDGETEKILNTNEYFLYTNNTRTNMIILGAGSKIIRNTDDGEWSVIALDPSKILELGSNFLTDNDGWFNLTNKNEMHLVENQFISINEGYKFKLSPAWKDEDFTNWLCQFHKQNSYSIRYSFNDVIIDKFDLSLLFTKLIEGVNEFTFDGTVWRHNNVSIVPSELSSRYGITVSSAQNGATINIKVITLNDFDIRYTDPAGTETVVGAIESQVGTWQGNSILNIYIDRDDELILKSNQIIRYITVNGEESIIEGADENTSTSPCEYPVVLLSSVSIKNNTTSIVPCYTVDENGVHYPIIYQFKKYYNAADNPNGVLYTSDGTILFTFTPESSEKEIKFNLPKGNYILGLANNYNEGISNLTVKLDGTAVHPMYGEETDLSVHGIYYLYIPITEEIEHKLKISMDAPQDTRNITLYNPYKYKKPVVQYRPFEDENDEQIYMSDEDFAKYEELLKRFDTENIFNYTYEVPADVEIARPCEAEAFNNPEHIFNKFTICAISEFEKLR